MSLQTFDPIEVNSEKNLKLAIDRGLFRLQILSKFSGIDEFTQKKYDSIYIGRVPCYLSFYNHISVGIGYATENEWILKLAGIDFMINNKSIPFSWCVLPNILNIERSNGYIQPGYFNDYSGLVYSESKKDFILSVSFNEYNVDIEPNMYSDSTKGVLLKKIMKLNNIDNIDINYKLFSNDYIESLDNNFKKEMFLKYNNVIKDYFEKTIKDIIDTHNLPINLFACS